MRKLLFLLIFAAVLAGCEGVKINLVPTTGDTALDPEAAQGTLPNLSNYGYTSSNARSLTDAISTVGSGAALLSGNPALAGGIAKIDDMIRCYESVGAVAANIYTKADIGQMVQGQIPSAGVLAVINRDRLAANLLPCALNTGQGFRAQTADVIEPCGGAGTFTRNNQTYDFIFAATDGELCNLFQAAMQ